MSSPKLVFITGPSGAGKSTTAEDLAANWPGICALLNFDQVRLLIRSGYAEPATGWNAQTERQWDLAKRVVVAMAKAYLSDGVSVVLEVFATARDLPGWKALFGDSSFVAVALLPAVEVVLARNSRREGVAKLADVDVRQNYEWSAGWRDVPDATVIDTSIMSVSDVSRAILALACE